MRIGGRIVLPEYKFSKKTIKALRIAMKLLKKQGITETLQREWLNKYLEKKSYEMFGANYGFSKNQTNDFINEKSVPIPQAVFLESFWKCLIYNNQSEILLEAWTEASLPAAKSIPQSLADHIHQFVSGESTLPSEKDLKKFIGRYVGYRPFFIDPEQVMITDLRCFMDEGSPKFAMDMQWPSKRGPVKERVDGYFIPYPGSCLFFGMIHKAGSPFVFVLTKFPKQESAISEGTGVVLVGAEGTTPSAYPIHISRIGQIRK